MNKDHLVHALHRSTTAMIELESINHTSIAVNDMARARKFYTETDHPGAKPA